jgi:D-beta-D-heptose 7-phosphate kinase/D-beta-D-heptose 1-phosphate adenosyltransferase
MFEERSMREVIQSLAGKRVVVVGDLMLDAYLIGEVRRISPEAPVPVLEVAESNERPGGAANTALNVLALGAIPVLIGVVGADSEGEKLISLLSKAGAVTDFVARDPGRPTTYKTRLIAQSQQIVRIDRESRSSINPEVERRLIAAIEPAIRDADACVLSDYQKGVLTPPVCAQSIACARALSRPVVVDPKGKDFSRYRGATVITPNAHELETATGKVAETEEMLVQAGTELLARLEDSALLVTRGALGMTLLRRGTNPHHLSTAAQRVYDVTGAGDTVVGTLAVALAAGQGLEQAMELANRAAGISVSKMGAATVTRDELLAAFQGRHSAAS